MSDNTYRLKLCWGLESGKCPNLITDEPDLTKSIRSVIESSGWPECLGSKLKRKIKPLDQFSISVSGCPNGCSRPQIADFGLLQAQFPQVSDEICTGCGICEATCKEGAIAVHSGLAGIDPDLCLSCGVCVRNCPEEALSALTQGYRVQVGGKLGRHPRLGDELPGIFSLDQVLAILKNCLHLHQEHYQPGLRFGQFISEQGLSRINLD